MIKILIVEDNKNIRKLYADYLTQQGYYVIEAVDGLAALKHIENVKVDLMVVDVMMPKMDGYELSQSVRDVYPEIPILMITAKDQLDDKLLGFKSGVDDYMVKPIELSEFLMRIQALLRRAKLFSSGTIQLGSTVLDERQFLVFVNQKSLDLPKKEFQLIFHLASNPNHVFTRAQLLDDIWGYNVESDERTIDVHIKRLREKFENNPDFEIKTIHGLGYRLELKNEKNTI